MTFCIAQKWLDIDKDNLRTGTAKALARLMSFVQITCFFANKRVYYYCDYYHY